MLYLAVQVVLRQAFIEQKTMTSSTIEIISATGNLLAPIAAILGAFLTAYLTKIWNTGKMK
jgi:hypothetical protein